MVFDVWNMMVFQEEWWVSHPKTGMCVRFHGRRYSKSRKTRPKTMTGQLQQFEAILLIYCWYSVLIYVNNLIKSQVAKLCKKNQPIGHTKKPAACRGAILGGKTWHSYHSNAMNGTKHDCYPLVNKQFAIENGPVEIVDLPIKNGDFPSFFVCLPEAISLPGGPGINKDQTVLGWVLSPDCRWQEISIWLHSKFLPLATYAPMG